MMKYPIYSQKLTVKLIYLFLNRFANIKHKENSLNNSMRFIVRS